MEPVMDNGMDLQFNLHLSLSPYVLLPMCSSLRAPFFVLLFMNQVCKSSIGEVVTGHLQTCSTLMQIRAPPARHKFA
jgi:hypothetical protein